MSQSILLLCPDFITQRMAGPAIRYWEFAQALAAHHPVTLAAPNPIPPQLTAAVPLVQHTVENIAELIEQHDIIIFQGYVLDYYPILRQTDKILITDLYDPIPLEGLEQGLTEPEQLAHQVRMMNDQLKIADYFLCANERQRDLWLGHLLALGRINHLTYEQIQQRVITVPFGLPDTAPQRTGPGFREADTDFVLLWGGGIWQWFDPLTVIRAVHALLPRYPHIRLVFLGSQHPNDTIAAMPMQQQAEQLAQALGIYGTQVIFQSGWVAYEQLHNHLLDADVGVSAHVNRLETHFSFRTRILHYLWAGKPIITTTGDVLAEAIEQQHAGIVVRPEAQQDWMTAIERLHHPEQYATYLTGVHTLAQRYRWSTVVEPLKALCADASHAKDMIVEGRLRKSLNWDCEQEYNALKCYLAVIEHSNSWRITAPLRNLRRWLGR